jgi:hypothetical protein
MLTVAPLIEQDPVAAIVGVIPEFVVAVTVNADWYGVVAGAPVKFTVGAALAAVVVCVTEVAAR